VPPCGCSFRTAPLRRQNRHRSLVRFQPVRLTAPVTPCGVPGDCRLSGLAGRGETELLTAKLDLHAPDAVVQHDAHQAHRRTTYDRNGPCARKLAEDMHLRRSSSGWIDEKAPSPGRRSGREWGVSPHFPKGNCPGHEKGPPLQPVGHCGHKSAAGIKYTRKVRSPASRGSVCQGQSPRPSGRSGPETALGAKSTTNIVA
jgi:hypothetical protein